MDRLSRNCCTWGRSFTCTWEGTASPEKQQHPRPDTKVPPKSGPAPQVGSQGSLSHPLPWDFSPWDPSIYSGRRDGHHSLSQPSVPPQGPNTQLSPPQRTATHLIGISLENSGDGGRGALAAAGEQGGAEQGPLLWAGAGSAPRPAGQPPRSPHSPAPGPGCTPGCCGSCGERPCPVPGPWGPAWPEEARGSEGLGGYMGTSPHTHTHRLGTAGSWHSSMGSPEK